MPGILRPVTWAMAQVTGRKTLSPGPKPHRNRGKKSVKLHFLRPVTWATGPSDSQTTEYLLHTHEQVGGTGVCQMAYSEAFLLVSSIVACVFVVMALNQEKQLIRQTTLSEIQVSPPPSPPVPPPRPPPRQPARRRARKSRRRRLVVRAQVVDLVARQPLVPPLGARPRRRLGVGVMSETQVCCSRYYKGCMCSLSSQCSLTLSFTRIVDGGSCVGALVWSYRCG